MPHGEYPKHVLADEAVDDVVREPRDNESSVGATFPDGGPRELRHEAEVLLHFVEELGAKACPLPFVVQRLGAAR